jgi:hypothetical protein
MKEIKITCRAAASLAIDKLEAFQGNLKTLNEKEYKKFRSAIKKHGFSFPVFVWKSGQNHFIIDGHQRLNTVRQMIKEGYTLKDNAVPVDWIEAKNKKEAKEKILQAMSQYGKYTEESLYEFIQIEGLDFEEEKSKIALPQIDLEKYFNSSGSVKSADSAQNSQLKIKLSIPSDVWFEKREDIFKIFDQMKKLYKCKLRYEQ